LSRELFRTAVIATASGVVASIAVVAVMPPGVDPSAVQWTLLVLAVVGILAVVWLVAWTATRARVSMAEARHARLLAAQARFDAETANAERQAALDLHRVAQEQIARAARERLKLLNELSHQLRTPLQAVVGWCDLVMMQAAEHPSIVAGLDVIKRNANAQARIIAEILNDGRSVVELLPMTDAVKALDGLIVLVVEEQDDSREFLRATIRDAGGCVIVAATAEEGLTALEAHRPDVIVSDIGLPGDDGLAFVQTARARGFADVPALALTGYTQAETRRRALDAGFREHAGKPVNGQELIALLSSLDPRPRV
jgi:CheY-like chemotaxis protein/Tfp pilus assembly protein PilE